MAIRKERRSDCPISYVLDIFGDRWTFLVIRDLLLKGKKTYGEFVTSDEKIATNILASRLVLLEEEGIISKEKDPTKGSRILYILTQKGIDLLPVLIEMMKWSASYDPDTIVPKEMVEQAKANRDAFLNQILEDLKKDQYLLV